MGRSEAGGGKKIDGGGDAGEETGLREHTTLLRQPAGQY